MRIAKFILSHRLSQPQILDNLITQKDIKVEEKSISEDVQTRSQSLIGAHTKTVRSFMDQKVH
jgi:hypothetical protein